MIRLLLIEDNEAHVLILEHELRAAGLAFVSRRVDGLSDLRSTLATDPPDAIISDYSLRGFDALEALTVLRASGLDVPFIVVSAFINEDAAVTVLKAGAHDFVLKDNLARLVPAIVREVADARARAELRRIQNELQVSDRMASLGMVAAGIAHEINNPIAALVANAEHARELCAELDRRNPTVRSLISCVADLGVAAQRIGNVVRDIQAFSRGDEDGAGPVDVHQVIDSSVRLASSQIGRRARIVKRYGEVPLVRGSESRLGQVLVNLLVNAAHAIGEDPSDEHEIRLITSKGEDGTVQVDVQDTGTGMSPHVLAQAFTPFFSTKRAGVGTGLGLAICQRIVASLGGQISLSSEVGRGTTATVRLPVADVTSAARSAGQRLASSSAVG